MSRPYYYQIPSKYWNKFFLFAHNNRGASWALSFLGKRRQAKARSPSQHYTHHGIVWVRHHFRPKFVGVADIRNDF